MDMHLGNVKQRRRTDYGYHLEYRTRWSDNDMLVLKVLHDYRDSNGFIGMIT